MADESIKGRGFSMRTNGGRFNAVDAIKAVVGVLCLVLSIRPAQAVPDYLLSEQPSSGSLFDIRGSFDSFRLGNGYGSGWENPLLSPDELEGVLADAFPSMNEFFRDATLVIRPRSYYRYSRRPNGRKLESLALGGALEIRSGWWNEMVRIGFTGDTSQKLYGPSGRGGTGLLTNDQGGISVLSEAWAEIRMAGVTSQIGRSSVDLPYLNRRDVRMIPQTFELASMIYQVRENLSFGLGYVSRIKPYDSDDFVSMSRAAGVLTEGNRGVGTVGLEWSGPSGVSLGVFNHYGWDTFNTAYAELQWGCEGESLPVDWSFGLQFTDQRSVGEEWVGQFHNQHYGARIAGRYKWVTGTLAMTYTGDDAGIRHPWGGSPSYASSMISDFDRAGEIAGRLMMQTDVSPLVPGLSGVLSLGYGDTSDGVVPGKQEELDFTIDYRPPLAPGLWLRIRQAWRTLAGETSTDFRVILNYERGF